MSNIDKNTAAATASASGAGFTTLLGIAFIILKLCGVIDWPWVWVLCPLWGGILLGFVVFAAFLFFIVWISKK